MKNTTALLCALWLTVISSAAQTTGGPSFEAYEQQIPGSSVSFKMIPAAAGTFLMGSPGNETGCTSASDEPRTVKVDAFWIGEHEVTYDEYILFQDEAMDTDPKPDGITRPSPPYVDFTLGMGKRGGFPANSMSQYAALMYCKWLYKKTGVFYRLPSEAEWEYAARAGSTAAWPPGNDPAMLSAYAWYAANSGNKYHRVKQLRPNAWGLYDMAGNVAEWTLDEVPSSRAHPGILKGGHFRDAPAALSSAARLPYDFKWNARDPQIPKSKWWNADAPFIGFRVVRPLQQPSPAEVQQYFDRMLKK